MGCRGAIMGVAPVRQIPYILGDMGKVILTALNKTQHFLETENRVQS